MVSPDRPRSLPCDIWPLWRWSTADSNDVWRWSPAPTQGLGWQSLQNTATIAFTRWNEFNINKSNKTQPNQLEIQPKFKSQRPIWFKYKKNWFTGSPVAVGICHDPVLCQCIIKTRVPESPIITRHRYQIPMRWRPVWDLSKGGLQVFDGRDSRCDTGDVPEWFVDSTVQCSSYHTDTQLVEAGVKILISCSRRRHCVTLSHY